MVLLYEKQGTLCLALAFLKILCSGQFRKRGAWTGQQMNKRDKTSNMAKLADYKAKQQPSRGSKHPIAQILHQPTQQFIIKTRLDSNT